MDYGKKWHMKPKFAEIRTLVCHLCRKKILRGEQYTWIPTSSSRSWANLCSECLIDLGKLGQEIDGYNKEFLKMPIKERIKKFKMLNKISKEEGWE